ncbi:DUF4434 domain-containing protein [Fibrobacterota bacterium]
MADIIIQSDKAVLKKKLDDVARASGLDRLKILVDTEKTNLSQHACRLRTLIMAALLLPSLLFSAEPFMTGIFDAGWYSYDRSAEQWDGQQQNMEDVGITTIVAQYGLVEGGMRYYPTSLDWAQGLSDGSFYLPRLLNAASAHSMDVYAGLYYHDAVWWATVDNATLEIHRDRCLAVIQELETLYGSSPALKGYYLPHEIAHYYWSNDADRDRLADNFLVPVAEYVRNQTARELIASPFYNHNLETAEQDGYFFGSLFSTWNPHIVAPQDGIGVDHATLDNVGDYLAAIGTQARRSGIAFWVNIELFEPGNTANPASISRLQDQLVAAAPHADKLIAYEYYHFSTSQDPAQVTSLYTDYKDYYDQNITALSRGTPAPSQILGIRSQPDGKVIFRIAGMGKDRGEFSICDPAGRRLWHASPPADPVSSSLVWPDGDFIRPPNGIYRAVYKNTEGVWGRSFVLVR